MKNLEAFLRPTQAQLFAAMSSKYAGKCVVSKDNFILVRGKAPVMLIAHLDTVHKEPVSKICKTADGNILMSPQGIGGDDRCGVYALNRLYEISKAAPWLLFTCDEEIGGVGAEVFCILHQQDSLPKAIDDLKMLIEIDRKGSNDAVYYDCANADFEKYITDKGFKTAHGSFSDISVIAPELGIAAVNLSAGYYNAHTLHEYIDRAHLNSTIRRVEKIIADSMRADFPSFEYVDIADSKKVPVPPEYSSMYRDLLVFYPASELDDYRKIFGDDILQDIYFEEYGDAFTDFEGGDSGDDDE